MIKIRTLKNKKQNQKRGGVQVASEKQMQNLTDEFICTQVVNRGLDGRTAKAYRIDLDLFFRWLESGKQENLKAEGMEQKMETYLKYLSGEQGLRFATVCRKHQVLGYYLSYLKSQGMIEEFRPLEQPKSCKKVSTDTVLSKKEVDAFFRAIHREYEELDSEFRKRVCLRDQIMMELLFYHRIEVSELLRMEVSDYNRKSGVLTIHRKREKIRKVPLFSSSLKKQMEQWLEAHTYFDRGGLYQNRMFLSKLGKPLSMKMITNIFDKYRVLAGIEKECTPKDLKNSLGRYGEELMREMG